MAYDDAADARYRAIVKTLLYIEAGALGSIASWLLVLTAVNRSTELAPLLGELFFALCGTFILIFSAVGYGRGKNYGRSPSVLLNLIALGVAYFQIQAHFWVGAIFIIALAVPTLYFCLRIIPKER